jgi:hypothetical protein
MFFWMRKATESVVRPRVTPDPSNAAELERRMNALQYHPENGFHRDTQVRRVGKPVLRLVR